MGARSRPCCDFGRLIGVCAAFFFLGALLVNRVRFGHSPAEDVTFASAKLVRYISAVLPQISFIRLSHFFIYIESKRRSKHIVRRRCVCKKMSYKFSGEMPKVASAWYGSCRNFFESLECTLTTNKQSF